MCHSDPSLGSSAYFGMDYFWIAAQVTDVPGKSSIANNGCGAARRMTWYCSSEAKGLNESLPCDLLESFGCRAGSQQLTQRKRKKPAPQQNPARKEN